MLAPPSAARAVTAHGESVHWKGVRCALPAGWRREIQGDRLGLTPPEAREAKALSVVLLPDRPFSGDFTAAFEAYLKRRIAAGEKAAHPEEIQPFVTAQGLSALRGVVAVRAPSGKTAVRLYVGAPVGGRMKLLAVLARDPALLAKWTAAVAEILGSWTFDAVRPSPAPAPRPSPGLR